MISEQYNKQVINTSTASVIDATLFTKGFQLLRKFDDRDVRRTIFVGSDGSKVTVSTFGSAPNLLDASFSVSVACPSDADELQLRRALDELEDEHPFVRSRVEVYRGTARLELSLIHELTSDSVGRETICGAYLDDFVCAVSELTGVSGVVMEEAA